MYFSFMFPIMYCHIAFISYQVFDYLWPSLAFSFRSRIVVVFAHSVKEWVDWLFGLDMYAFMI